VREGKMQVRQESAFAPLYLKNTDSAMNSEQTGAA
jgi:hypothetical protein